MTLVVFRIVGLADLNPQTRPTLTNDMIPPATAAVAKSVIGCKKLREAAVPVLILLNTHTTILR